MAQRKMVRLLAAGLAAVTLWGCTPDSPDPSTDPSSQPTHQSSQPTGPTAGTTLPTDPATQPPITEPPEVEPPEPIAPVTGLECTRWLTFPQLLYLGDGKVAACRNYYDKTAGTHLAHFELLDVLADQRLRYIQISGTRELVQQSFADGQILLADPASGTFHIYDRSLTETRSFQVPNTDGFFSHDRLSYYYLQEGLLWRMDLESGAVTQQPVEGDLLFTELTGIHPTEDLLIGRVYLSAYDDSWGLAVVDARTGQLRLLSDRLYHLWATGDRFYGAAVSREAPGSEVCIGSFSQDTATVLTGEQLGEKYTGWSVMPGSHLLVRQFDPDEGTGGTALLDLQDGTFTDLAAYGFKKCLFGATWLRQEQLILGFYEQGDYFYPVLLDPKAMDFQPGQQPAQTDWPGNVDQALVLQYQQSLNGCALDESLAQVQTQAQALEETYHVQILLGGQTTLPCRKAGYTALTAQDPAAVLNALDVLDQALSRYPEGFFRNFQGLSPESGVVICLTGKIDGDLPTVGFTKQLRQRYVLGLDITHEDLAATIHHEIWHAMEMAIGYQVLEEVWMDHHPEGYRYYGRYDTGYQSYTKWTWEAGYGEESFFIDAYSRINSREDRARIWEAMMTGNTDPFSTAPALARKLTILTQAIEARFPLPENWTWDL